MKLYIIRHGETPWNNELRLQGQTDIPLNEKGRLLAERTAEGMAHIPLHFIISSPLGRAMETAEIVKNGRMLDVLTDERIQEIGFGEMEGKHFRKDAGEDENQEYFRFFHAPDRYTPAAGGESLENLLKRTGEFLEELKGMQEWYGKSVLVSTHGAASRALLANVTHAPVRDFWKHGVPKNCAVTIVELIDGAWNVKELDKLYYENF